MILKRTLLTVLVSSAFLAGPTFAQENSEDDVKVERAAAAYKRGVAAYKEKQYFDAEVEFEAARQLAPRPTLIYNLALTKVKVGKNLEAAALFEEVIRETREDPALDKLNADATNKLDEVAAKLSRIVMDIKGGNVRVRINGKLQDNETFFVLPGRHVVKASAGTVESTWKIRLSAGEERVIAWEPGTQESKMELRVANRKVRSQQIERSQSTKDPKPVEDRKGGWHFGLDVGGVVDAQNLTDSLSPLAGVFISNTSFTLGADVIGASKFKTFVFRPNLRARLAPYIELEVAASISTGDDSFVAGAAGLRLSAPLSNQTSAELAGFVSYGNKEIGISIPVLFNLAHRF